MNEEVRCYWCNEPWVAHDGARVTIGDLAYALRPACDCYQEHQPPFWVTGNGVAAVVEGLTPEHAPPETAQQIRQREDEALQVVLDARLAAAKRDLIAALRASGQPVPPELEGTHP